MLQSLPIDEVLRETLERLRQDRCVVVEAPPGAGKSTRVPPAVLDAGLTDKQIVVLEPRRIAARSVAKRIAQERGSRVGGEVGWQIRWDRRGDDETRLWVITEGILTRRIQSDPFLDDIGVLVLDEFHERSIHTDLAIGFAKELLALRDDLYVVVMSATLDAAAIANYLGCGSVKSEGRTYPVDIRYLDRPAEHIPRAVSRAIRRLVESPDDDGGDILVFLPGMREIDDCRSAATAVAADHELDLHRLHGRLPEAEQDAALRPGEHRKVIFATNIAETSLTIAGVTSVIDTGQVRVAHVDSGTGFDRLDTVRISLASAEQRAGRAGRTQPGRAVRLWTTASEFAMHEYDVPAVRRIDLTGPILDVVRWSGESPERFPWFDNPGEPRIASACETLRALGAFENDWNVTSVGRDMAEMPLHPRIARFMLAASDFGVGPLAANIAASLSESDWVSSVSNDAPPTASDCVLRGQLLDEVADGRTHNAKTLGLRVNVGAARRTARVARDLRRWHGQATSEQPSDDARRALLVAYGDRVGFHSAERRFALTSGGSVVLGYESTVREAQVIVAPEVFGTTRHENVECGIARQVSVVEPEWLDELLPGRRQTSIEVRFDRELDRLVARRIESFDGLFLSEAPASLSDVDIGPNGLAERLAEVISTAPFEALQLGRDDETFLRRVLFLRHWLPELELPDPLGEQFLQGLCWRATSLKQVRKKNFRHAYRSYMSGPHFDALDRDAPEGLRLPSGRYARVDYTDVERPVLASRIQDFFGLQTTPTIAGGRVELLLHLLAPNMRPQQVTTDLASFWANTYSDVRKELAGRYPKHDWPEDPSS